MTQTDDGIESEPNCDPIQMQATINQLAIESAPTVSDMPVRYSKWSEVVGMVQAGIEAALPEDLE